MAQPAQPNPDELRLITKLPLSTKDNTINSIVRTINDSISATNNHLKILDKYCTDLESAMDTDDQSMLKRVKREAYEKFPLIMTSNHLAHTSAETKWQNLRGTEIGQYYGTYKVQSQALLHQTAARLERLLLMVGSDFFERLNSDMNEKIHRYQESNKTYTQASAGNIRPIMNTRATSAKLSLSCGKTLTTYGDALVVSRSPETSQDQQKYMGYQETCYELDREAESLFRSAAKRNLKLGSDMLSAAVQSAREYISKIDEPASNDKAACTDQVTKKLDPSQEKFQANRKTVEASMNELKGMIVLGDEEYNHTMNHTIKEWENLCSTIDSKACKPLPASTSEFR